MSETKQHQKSLTKPLLARKDGDSHRAATELELLFDLVFVIAIAIAALNLHHAIAEHHYAEGTIKFFMAFLMLWWPWVNFTWFANSFDNDDPLYRVAVAVMMLGVIIIAAGLPDFFKSFDLHLPVFGYITLRFAQSYLWFRAGKDNPEFKKSTQRYAWGQMTLQILWVLIAFVLIKESILFFIVYAIAILIELYVPYFANKGVALPWHKKHIVERYGLLNIIVLGEILLSAAIAMQVVVEAGHINYHMLIIAISAVITTLCLWWLYFCEEEHLWSDDIKFVFLWGYGHFFIFAPAASVGAGFAALVDATKHHAHGDPISALWAISISVSLYLLGLLLIRDRHILHKKSSSLLFVSAILIALTPLLENYALLGLTVLLVSTLVLRLRSTYK